MSFLDSLSSPFVPVPVGVEHALYRAKVWSKYAKDVIAYIEKRAQLDLDHCRALTKLAHVTRPALKDEVRCTQPNLTYPYLTLSNLI